jgi:hypothetical protein
LTLTEGDSVTVTFTVKNISPSDGVEITLITAGSSGPGNDQALISNLSLGSCAFNNGIYLTLPPGLSCSFSATWTTTDSGPEDGDSDVSSGQARVEYCAFSPVTGGCAGPFVARKNLIFTVNDPVSAPEPSSVFLLSMGSAAVLGLALLRRHS